MRVWLLALGVGLTTASPPGFAADETVAFWHFGTEETTRLEPHGVILRDQPGPRPPEFPAFDPTNTAVRLDGRGAHFRIPDPGDNSPFDFTNGDTITLEAWVNLTDIRPDENVYIVGKGRTHEPGFPRENQNWALRLRERAGTARVGFLFASAPTPKEPSAWHRWTSAQGFRAASGWHHVAVTYTFGKPDTMRGWLDGRFVKGGWDMGGATTRPPVVDNDAIWIGSSQGGNPRSSFRGLLDEIAIHRTALSDETMKSRYRRAGGAVVGRDVLLPLPALTPGKVGVFIHEHLETHDRWPADAAALPAPTVVWDTDTFLFPRLPLRCDDWGLRDSWKAVVMLRAAAEISLPGGRHRWLIRSRGGARLWLDGKLVGQTPFHQPGTDGHNPVPPDPSPPAPGARLVAFGDHESIAEGDCGAGRHTVVLETLVGGKRFRAEPGECCVAVQLSGESQFRLLSPPADEPVWLTDAGWQRAVDRQEAALTALDAQTRRTAAARQDPYWKKRHAHAQAWTANHPAAAVPDVPSSYPVFNAVDRFLAARMDAARAESKAADSGSIFHTNVRPILQARCFRCHGEKERGGLRLNTRAGALKGGDSGSPAITPGKPDSSPLLRRARATGEERMPPEGERLTAEQIALLEQWIRDGAAWPPTPVQPEEVTPAPLLSDASFLRRVCLDVVGVPPTVAEARDFLQDTSADKRARLVDRLLTDPRWADRWVSYWQDVLAENPSLVKPSLNNSGPFRYFLHDALLDNRPMDRLVTELVMMRGAPWGGGSAGFGLAADNDVPMAAKAHVLAGAFLGVEVQCARCHDAPFHASKQRDLFNLAAMLERKPLTLPPTSSVPAAFFEKKERPALIKVSLKPGERIEPRWPFAQLAPAEAATPWLHNAGDTREQLAAMLTLPQNRRFAAVLVNRVWKQLLGAGFVEPVHDWEGHPASHPELLAWLAHELVSHDYDLKHVVRLILTSHAYQREARGDNAHRAPERRFFAAPDRRRLTAEQVVDSLFAAAEKPLHADDLTFDCDSRQAPDRFLQLGRPRRAWEFASLANERDRPSLSLPRAQAVVDLLEAFGWNGSRQSPVTERETDPNVLQPAVLANGTVAGWITRLSDDSGLTESAVRASGPEELAEELMLRFLSRPPTAEEKVRLVRLLAPGFGERLTGVPKAMGPLTARRPRVSWTNHLSEESTTLMLEYARQVRAGEPPTGRLRPSWRERAEDAVWSVFNLPEFVWMP